MSQSRTDEILDIAEAGIRRGGFDAISFRDIADAIGIKSASIHYHFPKKADLGRAMVRRYAQRFIDGLGAPDDPAECRAVRLRRLVEAYRDAFARDRTSCLCAVLGAVPGGLPAETSGEVRAFFEGLLAWVERAQAGASAAPIGAAPIGAAPTNRAPMSATQIIALLQGAMILAVALDDPARIDSAAALILEA